MANVNKTELEKIFSDLSYTHLRDKSNSLLDYLLGFQLLKAEDDGKRAVGFFGFEIDDAIYYAPVFFLNGEVRGLDSIYSVEKDLFFPMTDGMVNHLINRSDVRIGERAKGSRAARGVREPSYNELKTIPGGTRMKLAAAAEVSEWMLGMPAADIMPLPEQLRTMGKKAGADFRRALKKSAALRSAVGEYYSLLDFAGVPEVKAAAAPDPVVIISEVTDAGVDQLTDDQRETILEGGTVVIDNRPEVDKAILLKQESARQLVNPSDSGVYDILMYDGSIEPMFVAPMHNDKRQLLLVNKQGTRCAINRGDRVFAVRSYGVTGLREHLADAAVPSDARVGSVVAFAGLNGSCSALYKILERADGLDGVTVLRVRSHDMWVEGNDVRLSQSTCNYREEEARNVRTVLIQPERASSPLYYGDKLVISDRHFRLVTLPITEVYPGDDASSWRIEAGEFGDWNTLWGQLDKVAQAYDVWKSGDDVLFKSASEVRCFRGPDVYRFLCADQGISKEAADELLGELSYNRARYWVKSAAIRLEEPSAPAMGGDLSNYHLTQPAESITIVDNDARSDNNDVYTYESPFAAGGDSSGGSTLDRITAASKSGDKEVFDATALAGLIKTYVPTDLVDRYMPSITVGMDRVGRILFLIYWHYKAFADRYGEEELADIMDNLRSVFEQLGDMVVNLKSRTMSGDPEHFGLGLGPETEVDNG